MTTGLHARQLTVLYSTSSVLRLQRSGNVAWNASLSHDSLRLVLTKYGFKVMDVSRKVRSWCLLTHENCAVDRSKKGSSVFVVVVAVCHPHCLLCGDHLFQEVLLRVPMHKIGWVIHYTENTGQQVLVIESGVAGGENFKYYLYQAQSDVRFLLPTFWRTPALCVWWSTSVAKMCPPSCVVFLDSHYHLALRLAVPSQ